MTRVVEVARAGGRRDEVDEAILVADDAAVDEPGDRSPVSIFVVDAVPNRVPAWIGSPAARSARPMRDRQRLLVVVAGDMDDAR